MGLYINPKNMSKEQWLQENATIIEDKPVWNPNSGNLPICLVDNHFYTVAEICFSYGEFQNFNNPRDLRPKKWYEASVEKLNQVTDGVLERYLSNNQKSV